MSELFADLLNLIWFIKIFKLVPTIIQEMMKSNYKFFLKFTLKINKILTFRMFCLISVPSTCVISLSIRSMIADVPKCLSSNDINVSLAFKKSRTCKQVN